MNCSVHTDRQAYEKCARCGAPVCLECGIKRANETVCQACMLKEKSTQPTMSGYAATQRQASSVRSSGGSAGYAKPLIIGLVTAVVCAVIWEQLVGITHIRFGAVIMGMIIGGVVGKTSDGCPVSIVPIIGAICAAVGVVLGEFLIVTYVGFAMTTFRLVIIALGIYEGYLIPRRMLLGH